MAAFADLSEVINRVTGGNSGNPETIFFYKQNTVAGAAASAASTTGNLFSFWKNDGHPAGAGNPGAVAAPDNTTVGGLLQTDPGGGREKWMLGGGYWPNVDGGLLIYDRLLHISGLDATVTTPQTVGGSLTRYTDGVGVMAFAEIYAQIGATARTITMSYTDDGGNSGQTSGTAVFGATGAREQGTMVPIPLASGDRGVQAVASVTINISTGTAGNFGVTLAKPLLWIPAGQGGGGGIRDCIAGVPSMQEVQTDACLALAFMPASTTTPMLYGEVTMVER